MACQSKSYDPSGVFCVEKHFKPKIGVSSNPKRVLSRGPQSSKVENWNFWGKNSIIHY